MRDGLKVVSRHYLNMIYLIFVSVDRDHLDTFFIRNRQGKPRPIKKQGKEKTGKIHENLRKMNDMGKITIELVKVHRTYTPLIIF